jgi:hypothetical protein
MRRNNLDVELTQLIDTIGGAIKEQRVAALAATGFHHERADDDGLPVFLFETPQGLVRYKLPTWDAVLSLSSELIKSRVDHDKASKDPLQQFMNRKKAK